MQKSPSDVITEARRWIGTPYHHQARLRGHGSDCIGTVCGVGLALGLMGDDFRERFKPFEGYSRVPNPRVMRRAMETFFDPLPTPRDQLPPLASIAWLEWREDLPMHLAIIASFADRPTMIHSFEPVRQCVEHTFDPSWRERVHSFWSYRGLV